jgi:hypothetical protein
MVIEIIDCRTKYILNRGVWSTPPVVGDKVSVYFPRESSPRCAIVVRIRGRHAEVLQAEVDYEERL